MTPLLLSLGQKMSTSRKNATPARILLVDDNVHGNAVRKALLDEQGYRVEVATSGEDAWELYVREPFDLVVTDLKMNEMTGLDLITHIRQSQAPALTILLSAWAACLGMTEQSTGADAVIAKSNHEGEQLLRSIRQLLARRTRRKPAGSEKSISASVARSG